MPNFVQFPLMVLVLEAVEEASFQLLISRLLIDLQKIKKYEHEAQILCIQKYQPHYYSIDSLRSHYFSPLFGPKSAKIITVT